MPSKTLITLGTLIGFLLPMSAQAYVPPNEVLTDENVYEGFMLPPTKRTVQQRAEEQRLKSQQRREAEQAGILGGDDEEMPAEEEETDATVDETDPDLEDILQSLEESLMLFTEQQNSTEAKRRQRLLDRIETEQQLNGAAGVEYQYGNGTLASQLHGGAPLAPTGPASIVAGLCLLAAGLWTVMRAGRIDLKR